MNEEKEKILKLVRKYAQEKLSNIEPKDYKDGDRIPYSAKVFDEEEVVNLVDSALEFWLTQGHFYDEFEKGLAKYLGVKYVSYVNSGSSANLIAFEALTSPLLKERRIRKGDEVITVACGFPTTISPIIQFGAVPVFLDMDIPTYNIKVEDLEKARTEKTKAVFVAHTLGNAFDIAKVKEFCDKYNLWLVEDNCDALGAEAKIGNEYKKTGTIGHIATSSFYPPHHMTTGEGGAVYTDDPLLHKIINSLRDWGRDCVCPSGVDNTCNHRYDGTYGELPKGYDHKYVYSHFGYNLKATDLQAAIGVAQLDKIASFVDKRRKNFDYLYKLLEDAGMDEYFILPKATKDTKPSWFAFILTLNDKAKEKGLTREKVVRYIESKNIQTRMLFAGNIIKQPCFDDIRDDKSKYRVIGDLKNTDKIMNDTFLLGVYPGLDEARLKYVARVVAEVANI
ncbi:MAG: lipopolysaccharide biosynthesis protein RfbH [Lachnospiraceae bacterium]|nr:lipopolysaccharide biosynthesis protein RfbH [Lachnospiraceae bacterium]